MPRKKTDEELETAVPDMAADEVDVTFEENNTPDCEEKPGVFITLKKGGSYYFGDLKFIKNKPVSVDEETAGKLMKTGFFERSGA